MHDCGCEMGECGCEGGECGCEGRECVMGDMKVYMQQYETVPVVGNVEALTGYCDNFSHSKA